MQIPWEEIGRKLDLKGDGGENISHEDLTLSEISVEFKPQVLREAIAVFMEPEQILEIHKKAEENPEIYEAVRDEEEIARADKVQKRTHKRTSPCSCRNCKAKKDKENK